MYEKLYLAAQIGYRSKFQTMAKRSTGASHQNHNNKIASIKNKLNWSFPIHL